MKLQKWQYVPTPAIFMLLGKFLFLLVAKDWKRLLPSGHTAANWEQTAAAQMPFLY